MLDLAAARDRHYDGRFLLGVLSTGIFCLPSCPARRPNPENVRFFYSPEAAAEAGLRACRRCRPELHYQRRDPDLEALERLVERVREAPEEFVDVDSLARSLGCSRSKLHRLMRRHYHSSPAALLQAARVDRAKEELLASKWNILDVGLTAGYESESAFHDNFVRATGLTPGAYRRMAGSKEWVLQLPPDFRAVATWRYLGRDVEQATERVEAGRAWRGLRIGRRSVVVALEQRDDRLRCRLVGDKPLPAHGMRDLHHRVWRWLGLQSDVAGFERRALRDPLWRPVVRRQRGLRLPQTPTVFEGLVWAIVGQQVNLAFAYRLRRQLVALCSPADGPRPHPTPAEVARLDYGDLTARQFSRRKAEYVIDVARWAAADRSRLEQLPALAASRAARRLEVRRGIGEWTLQYVLMRACGFADCVPVGDAGLVKALRSLHEMPEPPGRDATRELMRSMSPHRSLATAHLWNSLHTSDSSKIEGAAA